jgi:hypothetical protein
MAIFDLEDLEGARARAAGTGVRVAWQIDLPDISGTHLHPADMRGAIVSLDQSRPYGSWRWGGPRWTGQIADDGALGRLAGITLAVDDPTAVAARWAHVLGVPLADDQQTVLVLDGGTVRFVAPAEGCAEGLFELEVVDAPALPGEGITVGGVRLCSSRLDERTPAALSG